VVAREQDEVDDVAREIGGAGFACDVTQQAAVEAVVDDVERALGPIDLLVANAGILLDDREGWTEDPTDWWRVLEVNVLGVYLSCRAVIPRMLARGNGRIVITGSRAAYLPDSPYTAYSVSKAAVGRFGETLARQLDGRIPVFVITPGFIRTAMTQDRFPEDADWTPPELAPRLVTVLASGRADALSGRFLHAQEDDIEDLIARADEIRERDLHAVRLRR
jgi:3-oxoacyl-[acyl-carrier protein] reductase